MVLTGGSFRKGVAVPIGVPGRGLGRLGSGLGGWWLVSFVENGEKGKGVGRVGVYQHNASHSTSMVIIDYSLLRTKHQHKSVLAIREKRRQGFSLEQAADKSGHSSTHLSTSDPTVTGRSLDSGQLDDSL